MFLYTLIIAELKAAVGHWGSTPRIRRTPQALHSYPHPLERWTSKLRLLPPGPSQIRLVNTGVGFPTEAAQRPPAPRDG